MRFIVELINFLLGPGERNLIITRPDCIYCDKAMDLMDDYGIQYTEVMYNTGDLLGESSASRRRRMENNQAIEEIRGILGYSTFPMIFLNKRFIGGYSELEKLLRNEAAESNEMNGFGIPVY